MRSSVSSRGRRRSAFGMVCLAGLLMTGGCSDRSRPVSTRSAEEYRGPASRAPAERPVATTATAATRPTSAPTTSAPAVRRVHVFVSGRVQRVGFRAFTQDQARRLGLTGYVLNLPDGRVEAVIEGRADRVARMLEHLKHGPAGARVDKLEVNDEAPKGSFTTFSIER